MQPVSEHKITLNFHKYYAIARIDCSSNIITFYAYYFGNHVTLRKDFNQKNCVVLHTKIDINLHIVKRTSRAANLFNISKTKTYWIILVVIGSLIAKILESLALTSLLIAKVILENVINFFIHIFFIQLLLSLLHYLHYIGPK